jgi:hypothetical protein
MPHVRIKSGIDYEGDGDARGLAPHYFERLTQKYGAPNNSDPEWLGKYFPDDAVRRRFCHQRDAAFYYFSEAAKLRKRTTTGWHGKRRDAGLRSAGGKLARLKGHVGDGAEVRAALERDIAGLRFQKKISERLVRYHVERGTYHWHQAIFLVQEAFRVDWRKRLPWDAARGLRQWLSFPEIGITCTSDAVKRARRHFREEHRNGRAYRVYTNILGAQLKSMAADPGGRRFSCLLCERTEMRRDEFQPHLSAKHGFSREDLWIDPNCRTISLEASDEVVATWRDDCS